MTDRWSSSTAPKGADYDRHWQAMAARGESIHGEADFVCTLAPGPASVLDAGCGTGRIGIELAARGMEVMGIDIDEAMLSSARSKAPSMAWECRDLAALAADGRDLNGRRFDVVLLAGNVLLFVAPGTEGAVVARCGAHLAPGGALVAGFSLGRAFGVADLDAHGAAAGLRVAERWATWDRAPFDAATADYAVTVLRAVDAS